MRPTNYPSDVSDDEWAFVLPYLTLMREDAPQRVHELRAVFNGLRWIARTGAQWRMMPHDLPPWAVVYQQAQRWLKAGVFQAMVDDLRVLLRRRLGGALFPRQRRFTLVQATPAQQEFPECRGLQRGV
jgi:transposase